MVALLERQDEFQQSRKLDCFDYLHLPSAKALRDLEQVTDDAAFNELLGWLLQYYV